MDRKEDFGEKIAPFPWVDADGYASVCLSENKYQQEAFAMAGFEGSGFAEPHRTRLM